VTQQARNLLMEPGGQAKTIKFLTRDRDTKFTAAFDEVFHATRIRILTSPVQAPVPTRSWSGGSADAGGSSLTAP
jgi:putative transposase